MMAVLCRCVAVIWLCWALPRVRVLALDNGLAKTPPMGFVFWEPLQCNTDCTYDPNNCISDRNFRTMVDLVESEGYAAAGYEYVNLDGCWQHKPQSTVYKVLSNRMQPDPQRFPFGMKNLSTYVHSKGLKFGMYALADLAGASGDGGISVMERDASTFADWEVDYLKLDGFLFRDSPDQLKRGFQEFGSHLNRTGRPMVYSCSWPIYEIYAGAKPNYSEIAQHCNMWRILANVRKSWSSLESIIDYYGNNQDTIVPNAGPGHWNDPDMLVIGNFGLSYEQSKTQMALWAILAAPLLMSVDLRTIRPEYKAILQNKKIVAVDQDPMGIQGRRIYKHDGIEIWSRPITPMFDNYFSYGIAILNKRRSYLTTAPAEVKITLNEIGLVAPGGYMMEDLYEDKELGILRPQSKITVRVEPTGVVMLRADVQPSPALTTPPDDDNIIIDV